MVKHSRRSALTLGCTSAVLTALLIPHLIVAGAHGRLDWPPGLIVVHAIAAGCTALAALMIACTRSRNDHETRRRQTAYDAGRVHAIATYIEDLEQRSDSN